MEKYFDFVMNHPFLVSAWVLTFVMLMYSERLKGGKSVSPAEATRMINKQDGVVVDIRNSKEFNTGHLTNALNIPLADLDRRISELDKHKQHPVIVVCNLGQTSGTACRKLKSAGFTNAVRLSGGISEWRAQSMPVVSK